jgi:hypothetical protein
VQLIKAEQAEVEGLEIFWLVANEGDTPSDLHT